MSMTSNLNPFILSLLFSCSFLSLTSTSSADTYNIETYFPSLPAPAFAGAPLPPPPPPPSSPSKGKDDKVTKAVVATAASSFALSGLLFFAIYCFTARRRGVKPVEPRKSSGFPRLRSKANLGRIRSLIVDENGLDAIYLRELNQNRCENCNKVLDPNGKEDHEEVGSHRSDENNTPRGRNERRVQETPFLRDGSINSSSEVSLVSDMRSSSRISAAAAADSVPDLRQAPVNQQLPQPPGRSTSSRPPLPRARSSSSQPRQTSPPTPPPPQPAKETHAVPAQPPPPPPKKSNAGPPPPPPPAPRRADKKMVPGAPPSPPVGPLPPAASGQASAAVAVAAAEGGPKRLKPLHWDKVNPNNVEHSMVWDKITDGSFRYDEDILEALFGSLATNKKFPKANTDPSDASSSTAAVAAPLQICLLDSRKSQNIAIVLRSLTVSRQDILDALLDGHGLGVDTLERLTKIAPTKEDEALIRDYSGDPAMLADAESFLFQILRAVPAPFARLDAMLFRANYEPELSHLRQSFQTLEQACKELKTRGLFLKLLEAVLKAGNRMNAGTARGNAQAFNLTALCKLSDVKSTDGSTTLLHFVVQEVVRTEGKRLVINRNYSLRRSDSRASGGAALDRTLSRGSREEREKEYIKLGLPIVGGLSDEFANLKKAGGIDYDALLSSSLLLGVRVAEIKKLLETCGDDGFAKEMKSFTDQAEEELRVVREEQDRVLELVKNTTDYYQAGASKEAGRQQLQLFVTVRDFLGMVDKACVDIARNLQKKRSSTGAAPGSPAAPRSGSASPEGSEKGRRPAVRFPNLPARFMSERSDSSSDEE